MAFDFTGREFEGNAGEYLAAGGVSGPHGLVVVDVDGGRYWDEKSQVERLDR